MVQQSSGGKYSVEPRACGDRLIARIEAKCPIG